MQQATTSSRGLQKLKKLRRYSSQKETPEFTITLQHDPMKRVFDIIFSLSFLFIFSPLYLTLSFLIKISSSGPIFYKSPRLGRGGKIIQCWKFRTMFKDAEERLQHLILTDPDFQAEWKIFQKVKKDPRITLIGKFLRKLSLDETPQFWNVLKGDLSVVGPRPLTLLGPSTEFLREIRLLYGKSTAKILAVRPGITGVWQISGRSKITFEERRKMEEKYVETRNFWSDIFVIIKTVPAVFFSKGAF